MGPCSPSTRWAGCGAIDQTVAVGPLSNIPVASNHPWISVVCSVLNTRPLTAPRLPVESAAKVSRILVTQSGSGIASSSVKAMMRPDAAAMPALRAADTPARGWSTTRNRPSVIALTSARASPRAGRLSTTITSMFGLSCASSACTVSGNRSRPTDGITIDTRSSAVTGVCDLPGTEGRAADGAPRSDPISVPIAVTATPRTITARRAAALRSPWKNRAVYRATAVVTVAATNLISADSACDGPAMRLSSAFDWPS